ncbi:MAG: Peroxisomal hydratase-dehydrogenase-epimerase, partial [Pseudonocardiales bacterium]|nr:Peroxisomal hydratase-dehydrogenase-epimerase [Pseudonocardiales bacterium]
AKVVVNDLGASTNGSGADVSAAQAVADEINSTGGEAVASTESVTDFAQAAQIVERAVDTFGDLDIVVNNAGILRDRMLVSMSEEEFDAVIDVHLKGTFNVSRHAAALWRDESKRGTGRPRAIVNTASGAGLHGNVGQTNYAAAKAGIAAMTVVHARELERYGVRANGIAPIARTRLTLQTPGWEDRVNGSAWDPSNISPLVAYLASSDCAFTGQMFSVYGGCVGIYSGWSTFEEVRGNGQWDPAALGAAMEAAFPATAPSVNPFIAAVARA